MQSPMPCVLLARIIFFSAMGLFSLSLGFAADVAEPNKHYIWAGATGDDSGRDWNNALRNLPSSFQRGHVYYIADGIKTDSDGHFVDYLKNRSLNDPVPASSDINERWITIRKATDADHGTDVGWSSEMGRGRVRLGKISFGSDYYVIDGGKRSSPTSGHGFVIYVTTSGSDASGVDIGGRHFITLRNLEIKSTNLNNKTGGIDSTTEGASDLTFQNLYLHFFWGPPIYFNVNRRILIESSVISDGKNTPEWHSEAIQARSTKDLTIRYSQFFNIEGTGVIVSGSGDSGNWRIYGNIFDNRDNGVGRGIICDNEEEGGRPAGMISNVYIYNNVFTRFKGGKGGISFVGGEGNLNVINNIWYDVDWIPFDGDLNRDYNFYSKAHFPFAISFADHENGEVEDREDGKYSKEQRNPFMDSAKGDFRLKAALPIDGMKLSSPYNKDATGATRGSDGVFDIGAYEFSKNVPPDTTSPTVSIASPKNGEKASGNITVLVAATDNVGITKVDLYIDNTLKASDRSLRSP